MLNIEWLRTVTVTIALVIYIFSTFFVEKNGGPADL